MALAKTQQRRRERCVAVLIFATSDKGGTGRSVTSGNLVYRRALHGSDVCYLDFDFGSPTSGAIFGLGSGRGTTVGGLHSFLQGRTAEPARVDVWAESDRFAASQRPAGSGRLVLFPGDEGGGEFPTSPDVVDRCTKLFLRLEEEFEMTLVDLSAGRSYALQMALEVTAREECAGLTSRWLIYHRWTRQHIIAANGLVFGDQGIIQAGMSCGHDKEKLQDSIRFVRTAVLDLRPASIASLRAAQAVWLQDCNTDLQELAGRHRLGRAVTLGIVPLDPVLQWREQLISDEDARVTQIANLETIAAYDSLALRLVDDSAWEGL